MCEGQKKKYIFFFLVFEMPSTKLLKRDPFWNIHLKLDSAKSYDLSDIYPENLRMPVR